MISEFRCIAAATALLSAGCVSAPPPPQNTTPVPVQVTFNVNPPPVKEVKEVERGAISGVPQHVGFFYSVNPDCSSGGLVRTMIKKPASHGSITFVDADGYTNFPRASESYDCNKQKSPGVEVVYKSNSDFVGTDRFTVQAIGPKGRYMETDYLVKVIAP